MNTSSTARDEISCRPGAPQFAAHARELLQPFRDAGVIRRLRARQVLTRATDSSAQLHIVEEGMLVETMHLSDRRRSLLGFYYPGEPIACSTGLRAGKTVLAATAAVVLRVGSAGVQQLLESRPAAAGTLIAALSRRAERASLHGAMLALKGEERLATFLLEAAMHMGRRIGDHVALPMPIGREDIADYLGLNADTVSRIFSRLKRAGILAFDGRSMLHVLDWRRLSTLSPFAAALWPGAAVDA